MYKPFVIFLFAICMSTLTTAQEQLTWFDFADVKFVSEYNEKYGIHFLTPKFGERIQSFQDKRVTIRGYYLDISGNGEISLVSQNPMASCFFCGASGPETIIEVRFKEKPPYKTDDIIEVTGVLELNAENVDNCNYILNEATAELVN